MPKLDVVLQREIDEAIGLIKAGEMARSMSPTRTVLWSEWKLSRLEALHELAFLRIFVAWEAFLQDSLCRYMCGHESNRFGQAIPKSAFFRDIKTATSEIHKGKSKPGKPPKTFSYLHWYEPKQVIQRSKKHLTNSRHEIVLKSFSTTLRHYAKIRHRIAHGQEDAKTKFRATTLALSGRRCRGSRPGRFLREWTAVGPRKVRWLEKIADELSGLAQQIV